MLPSPERALSLGGSIVHVGASAFGVAVRYASVHTGVPAVVVAATALVVSYRVFKRTLKFAVQLALALTLVLAATELGWLRF